MSTAIQSSTSPQTDEVRMRWHNLWNCSKPSAKLPKIDPGLVCWSDLLVWDSNMPWPTCSNKVYLQKLATSISYFCEHTLINCCQKSIVVCCFDVVSCAGLGYKPETRKASGRCGGKSFPHVSCFRTTWCKRIDLFKLTLQTCFKPNVWMTRPNELEITHFLIRCLLSAHCPEQWLILIWHKAKAGSIHRGKKT